MTVRCSTRYASTGRRLGRAAGALTLLSTVLATAPVLAADCDPRFAHPDAGVGDAWGPAVCNSANDQLAAFQACINQLTPGDQLVLSQDPLAGADCVYRLSGPLVFSVPFQLTTQKGVSGIGQGEPANTFYFYNNTKGLVLANGSNGSVIQRVKLQGSYIPLPDGGVTTIDGGPAGVTLNANATLDQVAVVNFSGDGIDIIADSSLSTLATDWTIVGGQSSNNQGNGVYLHGNNTGSGYMRNVGANYNGQWGVLDTTIHASTFETMTMAGNKAGAIKATSGNQSRFLNPYLDGNGLIDVAPTSGSGTKVTGAQGYALAPGASSRLEAGGQFMGGRWTAVNKLPDGTEDVTFRFADPSSSHVAFSLNAWDTSAKSWFLCRGSPSQSWSGYWLMTPNNTCIFQGSPVTNGAFYFNEYSFGTSNLAIGTNPATAHRVLLNPNSASAPADTCGSASFPSGTIELNPNASPGGYAGYICTCTGVSCPTSGTFAWKTFGVISP